VEGSWKERTKKTYQSKKTERPRTAQEERKGGEGRVRGRRGDEPSSKEILTVLTLNAQSIKSKVNDLNCLLQETKPDLVIITESWLNNDDHSAALSIEGYFINPDLRIDRTDTAHGIGGGILVYVKEGLVVLPNYDRTNTFNQYCQFKVQTKDRNNSINFTVVYRSPNSNEENLNKLCELLQGLSNENQILVGDFNLPGIDWEIHSATGKGKNFTEIVQNKLLVQHVDFPTHVKGNILDLVITNMPESVLNVEDIGNLGTSDHSIILLEILCDREYNSNDLQIPDWNNANINDLKIFFGNIDWENNMRGKNVEEAWNIIKNTIDEGINRFVPKKRRRQNGRPPWMTRTILRQIRKKQRKWNNYMKNQTNTHLQDFKN